MQERWTPSLGQEDPLEEGMATCSRILAWRIPMDRGAWQATVHGVAKSRIRLKGLNTHTGHREGRLFLYPLSFSLSVVQLPSCENSLQPLDP